MGDFDVDQFLEQPLVARVATNGPTVRPVWFLWEKGAFWWLTGSWSRLAERLRADPAVALVVDTCDVATGSVRQVQARGHAEILPFNADRARRKLTRYLGDDPAQWDQDRFGFSATGMVGSEETEFVRLVPEQMAVRDLSFTPSSGGL
jgi:nitroimidazol reductase NimA-like FMN-containing flavoprotein (pyridoxamine 5'-phosphate oxidase superfamily)